MEHRAKCCRRWGYKTGGGCRKRPSLQFQTENKTGINFPKTRRRYCPASRLWILPRSLTYWYKTKRVMSNSPRPLAIGYKRPVVSGQLSTTSSFTNRFQISVFSWKTLVYQLPVINWIDRSRFVPQPVWQRMYGQERLIISLIMTKGSTNVLFIRDFAKKQWKILGWLINWLYLCNIIIPLGWETPRPALGFEGLFFIYKTWKDKTSSE